MSNVQYRRLGCKGVKILKVSFGTLIPKVKSQFNNIDLTPMDRQIITKDMEENKNILVTDLDKNHVEMLASTGYMSIDYLSIQKCNPDAMKVKSLAYQNKDILVKTMKEEENILNRYDKDKSHLISAWLISSRVQDRCEKAKQLLPTPISIWGDYFKEN